MDRTVLAAGLVRVLLAEGIEAVSADMIANEAARRATIDNMGCAVDLPAIVAEIKTRDHEIISRSPTTQPAAPARVDQLAQRADEIRNRSW